MSVLCNCGFNESGGPLRSDDAKALHAGDVPRSCIEFQKGRIQAMEQKMREFAQEVQEAKAAGYEARILISSGRDVAGLQEQLDGMERVLDEDAKSFERRLRWMASDILKEELARLQLLAIDGGKP